MMSTNTSAFRDAVISASLSKQLGENGMPEYTDLGVGSDVLVLSQLVRGGDPRDCISSILRSGSTSDIVDLFVLIFATRNARGGKGEKKLSYDMFLRLYTSYPDTCLQMLKLFPHYGYWKDMLQLIVRGKELEPWISHEHVKTLADRCADLMAKQLNTDIAQAKRFQKTDNAVVPISLLAKWLPREGSAFDKNTGIIELLCSKLWPIAAGINKDTSTGWESAAKRKYRKTIVQLTSLLALPEVLLAAKREEEIQFHRLASRATMKLKLVFLNETKEGGVRSENPKRIRLAEHFLEYTLKNGGKGGQVMPHEIVSQIMKKRNISRYEELVFDAMWKDIVQRVLAETSKASEGAGEGSELSPTRMVPLCDVSGSMSGVPMEVSIALGILISEITHPAFRGMVLTFESDPRWHILDVNSTIVEKVRSLGQAPWGCSTDFAKAYRLILETARSSHLKKEDMPSMIVFSDMQFDEANEYGVVRQSAEETMHECIKRDYRTVGTELGWVDCDPDPIVYWNLRNTGGHPVNKDTEGAVLLSGYSPSLLKLVMYGGALEAQEIQVVQEDGAVVTKKIQVTPAEVLRKMLSDKLYDPVRMLLGKSTEGKLIEYECLEAETMDTNASVECSDFELV